METTTPTPGTLITRADPLFDLDGLKALCAGRSGGAGDEWSIGYQKGDAHIRLYSGIGSVIFNAIKRNRAAIVSYCVDRYPDGGFSVQMRLDPARCRAPWMVLKTDGSGDPMGAALKNRLRSGGEE